MRTTNEKAVEYLKSNPIVAKFIQKLDNERKEYYEKAGTLAQFKPVTVEVGNKFIRIWHGTSCWGFISRVDDVLKGAAKGKFTDTAEITKFDQQIPLSERTRKALTKVSPQDVGMVGSDFGECLGAIALLKSVVNAGSGIVFPAAEANPLADFQLDGFNVSAKYNKGGAATITDTVKNIKPEQLTTPGQKSLYKFPSS